MIQVTKDYSDIPDGLLPEKTEHWVEKALEERERHEARSHIYSQKEKLCEIYRSKCAYCETPASPGWDWQVDHYRPTKGNYEHGGYHWLAYEWSNLLLVCGRCNGNGAKSN